VEPLANFAALLVSIIGIRIIWNLVHLFLND
jgi:hypothetical protein